LISESKSLAKAACQGASETRTAKPPHFRLKIRHYAKGETTRSKPDGSGVTLEFLLGASQMTYSYIPRGLASGLLMAAFAALLPVPVSAKPAPRIALTVERMSELQQINSYVNSTIFEVSDMEQYGREDVWTLPKSGKGDCEDFALLKRKLLIERGWPASALLISVGTTSQGEPHAVLIATTDRGEYVLDNLTSSILTPAQTGHVFHSRQSGRGWVSASGERTSEPTVDLPVARRLPVAQFESRRPRG
jgi:predicted transglutaminase-like cysteine proteinase